MMMMRDAGTISGRLSMACLGYSSMGRGATLDAAGMPARAKTLGNADAGRHDRAASSPPLAADAASRRYDMPAAAPLSR